MPTWLDNFLPILILLAVVAVVIARLPRVEGLDLSASYRRRRVLNWLPLGLTYAFLYMGRYNLTVAKDEFQDLGLMDNAHFATIFGVGTFVYGCAFVLNGPLTDRFGGKAAILAGALGSLACNALTGWLTMDILGRDIADRPSAEQLQLWLVLLYGTNMYFQSFGAVAIVKCNAPWFHVRERGVFGAIFGILISLGIYFAFDVGRMLLEVWPLQAVFFVPAVLLAVFSVVIVIVVRNTPGQAGHTDFDTGDAASPEDDRRLGAAAVFAMMLRNPVILTIALIEFCSGFLRQAIMQWYRTFIKQTEGDGGFVYDNWGMLLCAAGILGGVVAGVISDRVFQSRRGPVAALLYSAMLIGAVLLAFLYRTPALGPLVVVMSLCVIGVHGMLSGTASMDFGGRKNAGTAVGIIDGFVYAGTGVMSLTYWATLPNGPAAADPANWMAWPIAMIPVALIGTLLSRRVWHATPR